MLTLLVVLCLRLVSGPIDDPGAEERMLAAGRYAIAGAARYLQARPLQSALTDTTAAVDKVESNGAWR